MTKKTRKSGEPSDGLFERSLDGSRPVRWCIFAAIVSSAVLFDLGSAKPFDVVKMAAVWTFGWLAVGCFVVDVLRGRQRIGRFRMGWLAGAFVLASVLSTAFSHTPVTALFGWYGRYGGLLTIVVLVLIFYVVSHVYAGRPDRIRELILALSVGAIVLVVYILMQWMRIDPVHWVKPSGDVPGALYFGTLGNADFAGGYLGLTFPCIFHTYRRTRESSRRALIVVWAVAQFGALLLTSARNGIVAFGLAGLVLLFVYRARAPRWLRIGATASAAAAAILALVIVLHPGRLSSPDNANKFGVLRAQTLSVRGYWWFAGLRIFEHHPILGTGPDTYVSEFPRYLPRAAASIGDSENADKPHNIFVDHLATQGLVGTALYLALLALAFVSGFRRLRELRGHSHLLTATLLAMLAGYVGQGAFSIDVVPLAVAGWVVLGAIAAMSDPPRRAERADHAPSRPFASGAVLFLALVVAMASTFPLRADHEAHTAARLADANASTSGVLAHYRRAMSAHRFEPAYPAAAASFLIGRSDRLTDPAGKRPLLIDAVAYAKRALDLEPDFYRWMLVLGEATSRLADAHGPATFASSDRVFRKAQSDGPYDWRVHLAYGDMLLSWARSTKSFRINCRAQAQYARAAGDRPGEQDPHIGLARTYLVNHQGDAALVEAQKAVDLTPENPVAKALVETATKYVAAHLRPLHACA